MKSMAIKLITSVVIAGLLGLPAGLSAKQRRGANIIVTRLDGRQHEGELIAVKPDSLLLLSAGKDLSIERAEIRAVRIVRKSRAWLFAGLGGAVGLAGTGALVLGGGGDVDYGTEKVLIGAGIGALSGLLVGIVAGIDSEFTVAGQPEAVVADSWQKLGARSREGRLPGLPIQTKAVGSSAPSEVLSRTARAPRFKIGLSAAIPILPHGYRSTIEQGSFRFTGDVPPEESNPYSVSFRLDQRKQLRDIHFGPLSLAYEWTERLSAEVELVLSGRAIAAGTSYGEMAFTSGADGREYRAYAGSNMGTSFVSLLFGLTFRTKAPSALNRHIFEVGAAVGPALGKFKLHPWGMSATWSQDLRKVAFSGRIHSAYDFYILPTFSVGVLIGYRYLELDFSGLTYSAEVEFREVGNESNALTRLTEVVLPGPPIAWSSPFLGFRLGFRI
jgi:hypothetical protein